MKILTFIPTSHVFFDNQRTNHNLRGKLWFIDFLRINLFKIYKNQKYIHFRMLIKHRILMLKSKICLEVKY